MTETLFVPFYSRLHYPYLGAGAGWPRQIVRKINPAGGEMLAAARLGTVSRVDLRELSALEIRSYYRTKIVPAPGVKILA